MAEGYEVAKAVVTLIPSMQGSQAAITKELTGASAVAGKSAGENMGKSMTGGLSSSMSSVGKTIAGVIGGVAVVGAVKALGTAIFDSFKEVDAGLDTIRTKTGASGQQLEGMRTNMENLATSIPTSFEDAGEAIGEVNTRFGATGEQLETLSGQFIKFAKLNNTDITSSVDNVQKALSAFGLQTEDAGNMLDVLNKVGQDTGVNIDTLTKGLIQNGTAFQEMGLSADQAVVFMGRMEKSGANSETVMQGLRKALKNATEDGVSMKDALKQLQSAILNGTDGVDGLSAAYDLFGKSGDQIYSAIKNGTLDFEALGEAAVDAAGSVSTTFDEITDPTDEFGEVMNRLKIVGADLAESAMPMLKGALEGVAGAIEFVVDALTPAETALTRFIDDTQASIDANQKAIEQAESAVGKVTSSIDEMEIYKSTLIDLLDKSEKTELEQFMLKDAVEQLSSSVPGLKEAYDEVNGTFSISNEEIIEMINNAEALAIKSALIEAQKETYKNYADALVNAAKASQGLTRATEEYINAEEYTYSGLEGIISAGGVAGKMYSDQARAVRDASQAQYEAGEALEQAKNDMQDLPEAIDAVAKEYGIDLVDSVDSASDSLEEAGETAIDSAEQLSAAASITEDEFADLAKSTGLTVEELQNIAEASDLSIDELSEVAEYTAETRKAFEDLQKGIETSINNSIDLFSEFSGGAKLTAEEMVKNLSGANAGVEKWIEDMKILGAKVGDEFPQALYDELLEKGPEQTANAVSALAEAASNSSDAFKAVSEEYARKLNLANEASTLAQFSAAGKAVADNTAQGVKNGTGQVETAAKEMATSSMKAADGEIKTGTTEMRNSTLMGMNEVNNVVLGQLNTMQGNFSTAMGIIQSNVSGMISNVRAQLSTTLRGPNIQVPHFSMSGAFDAKTGAVPTVSVAWYAKGGIFTQPTILATPYGLKGVGEAGAEAVLPIDLLKNYIDDAMNTSPVVNVEMTVNGADDPNTWAAEFARTLKQQMRVG